MDRGRGRGRGLGPVVGAYNRGTSYEDEGGEHGRREGPSTGYGRGARPFERTQVCWTRTSAAEARNASLASVAPQSNTERVWVERPERNGATEDRNGSTSPRKEFVGRPFADNWRSREGKERDRERERGEVKEDDDGWRTAGRGERWGKS